MSKFVYKVSRFLTNKQQLRLAEYYGRKDDNIKALATLHFRHDFISGCPLAFVYPDGRKAFSFHRKDVFADKKLNFVINFPHKLVEALMSQVSQDLFIKPTTDDMGVSLLRKWQLHIELEDLAIADLYQKEQGSFLTVYVPEEAVKSFSLVSTKEKAYVHTPGDAKVKLHLLMDVLFNSVTDEDCEIPETLEETENAINSVLSKAQKRGVNRKRRREAQQKTTETSKESTKTQEESTEVVKEEAPKSSSFTLVEADVDVNVDDMN